METRWRVAPGMRGVSRLVIPAHERAVSLTGVFVIDSGWTDFIGSDWQSSRSARQGFLADVLADQEHHARLARAEFTRAAGELPRAEFTVLVGTPAEGCANSWNAGNARPWWWGGVSFSPAAGRACRGSAAFLRASSRSRFI